jgi:HNH endonuclease
VDVYGYPRFMVDGKWKKAHRLICDAPPGELACHHCDVRSCVNPDHIYLGTPKSNMADKMRRGRWKGGRKPRGVNPDAVWFNPWKGYW